MKKTIKRFGLKLFGLSLALSIFSSPLLADIKLLNNIEKGLTATGDVNVTGVYKDATGTKAASTHSTILVTKNATIGQSCTKGSLANKSNGSLLACVSGAWSNASASTVDEYVASSLWWLTSGVKNKQHYYSGYWKYAWTSAFVAKYSGYYTIQYMGGQAGSQTVVWTKTWLLKAGHNLKTYHSGSGNDENRTYINGAYVFWNTYGGNAYGSGEGFRVSNFRSTAPAPY